MRPPGPPGGGPPPLTPRIATRIAIFGAVVVVLLGVVVLRLWFLQVIGAEGFEQQAQANRTRTIISEAPRGAILDRKGRPIVLNRVAQNVVALPQELQGDRRDQVLARLAPVLRVPESELAEKMDEGDRTPFQPVVLAKDVDRALYLYLSQRSRQYPGVTIEASYLRDYTEGAVLAHVLGYTGPIPEAQADAYRRRGYRTNETVGLTGIERQYEDVLRGRPGRDEIEVDAAGQPTSRGYISRVPARPGNNLVLSIDLPTQKALEAGLARQLRAGYGAAGVAMDPYTGEVLALASMPAYDPAVWTGTKDAPKLRLFRDPSQPLLNRAIDPALYPSGSTFKVVTATAALERGLVGADDLLASPPQLTIAGTIFRNFEQKTHGLVTMRTALQVSSDTYFYQLGERAFGEKGTPIQDWARRYGFGARTGIDLPDEAPGLVPDPAWMRAHFVGPPYGELDRIWKTGDSVNLSVGQGYLGVSPVQLAVAYAAIANNGTVMRPTVGRFVRDENNQVLRNLTLGRADRKLGASEDTLRVIRDGLYLAANEVNGTSVGVFGGLPDDYTVAGKTGTAEQQPGTPDNSWFVGYAPYQNPRIVVAVGVERGGQGSNAAAPIVCGTMAAYLRFDPNRCGSGAVAN
jgi:penicillin-binding protein 2